MIIAIDGPSGTGKSTVAKEVARRLGYTFFDTGAMYRSIAWLARQRNASYLEEEIAPILKEFDFEIRSEKNGDKRYFVNGEDVSESIRTSEISLAASKISTMALVRQEMVKIQRQFSRQVDCVFEGRDMGTVVFPDAELKVFLTARSEVRGKRRYRELLTKFPDLADSLSFEQILKEIEERDQSDENREVSPLKQADDAILIDTSDLSAEQVIAKIIKLHKKMLKRNRSTKSHLSYWVVYWLVRGFLKCFYRLRVYGLEHFQLGSAIIAANHLSFFDPPVISVSCPEEVHFLARESLFRIPVLGRMIRSLNSHPVSRDSSDAKTFRELIVLLQKKEKVILFPEGQRSLDGTLQPLEKGLAFLVFKAHCSIFPVYVSGTFDVWKRGACFPRLFGKIRCVFGSPIQWKEFEGLEKREAMDMITKRTEASLHSLKKWLDEGAEGTPP